MAVGVLILLVLTALLIYAGNVKAKLNVSLYPGRDGNFLWASSTEPAAPIGKTQLTVNNEVGAIDYDFFLDPDGLFPYTHYSLYFIEPTQPHKLVDLTAFDSFNFRIICDPKNVLLMVLFSFDEKVTDFNNMATRRVSTTAFTCESHWADISIKFDDLMTPHWWLGRYGYDFSDQGFQLDKVMGFAWVNSLQSPMNTPSHVKLTDVSLRGYESRYLYMAVAISGCLWVLAIVWALRHYVTVLIAQLDLKIKQDQPLMAYKQLTMEPHRDKEKSALLRYIATEYANPDLNLDVASAELGINRTKINEILKVELSLTFSAYLNKLRLTEAARLLAQNEAANISEIAYVVGYNNVSYFNKLFKSEYGCAPKTFKSLYQPKDTV
jgi:AraC-like DNA-binding protein